MSAPPPAAGCMWDATEFVLKASMLHSEAALLEDWIDGYLQALSCFPRLHVITAASKMEQARRAFARVRNVTIRPNNYPPAVEAAGSYVYMQWPMMWVDNFTTAPHIVAWDVDSIPILPLRCHHLFNEEERPYWWSVTRTHVAGSKHGGLASWTRVCSERCASVATLYIQKAIAKMSRTDPSYPNRQHRYSCRRRGGQAALMGPSTGRPG